MLHNITTILGMDNVVIDNMPPNYDLMLIPTQGTINYDGLESLVSFDGILVDFGTGTYAKFFLSKIPTNIKSMDLFLPTRNDINKLSDFLYTIEGRYLSFWVTSMEHEFSAVNYAPLELPDVLDLSKYNGETYLYSLNWGQKLCEDMYKNRLLAVVYNGHKSIHINKISSIEIQSDYRVIKLNLDFPLPEIYVSDINIITTFMYVRSTKDSFTFNYVTSTIAYTTLEVLEDIYNVYNPYTELPKIYPEGS